jgi:acyl-CoA synthetase (AMP-forming)/AMP-acid ligase II
MSLVPSLFAPILYQSRMNPDAIAIVGENSALTYGEFCTQVENVTRRLHALAIPPGTRVAVQMANQHFKWLATLALSRLGLVSATVLPREVEYLAPDLVIADDPQAWPGRKVLAFDPEWVSKSADDLPPLIERGHEGTAHARLVTSSGTTGTSKVVVLTYDQLHRRNKQQIGDYGFTAASRLMITIGGIAGLMLPVNCWSAGGSVVLGGMRKGVSTPRLLRARPNILMISPSHLETLLAGLPADSLPMPEMRVYVAGSAMARTLSVRARMRLTPLLMLCYGSTEIGTIALAPAAHADSRPGMAGYVVPPVQLEIVDEKGVAVARGTAGEVRIRAEGQADCYLDDPATTAANFRDGWFHPGDIGMLGEHGELRLIGRATELMNFGGAKRSPEVLEDALRSAPGLVDLAAFSFATPQGERPGVAVIATAQFSAEALARRFAEAFPNLPPLTVFPVETIPRNEMGKVLRKELAALLTGGAQEPGAKPKTSLH